MSIKIFNEQDKIKLDIRKIRKYLPSIEKKMLLSKDDGYNIIFIDDREIKKLNKKFRKTNHPTDVLSFKNSHNKCSPPIYRGVKRSEADIFISVETAKSNAKFYKQVFYIEILRLIIHGMLHSIGYTDYSKKAKKMMWEKQEQVLKCIM
ncbi:MAG: rRNA maturation RNase YbeY [Candidatus Delongbacteria bacterium]|nr:rRNA maturation RNase YbeY [Candidatus Delongbacteria bacterium]